MSVYSQAIKKTPTSENLKSGDSVFCITPSNINNQHLTPCPHPMPTGLLARLTILRKYEYGSVQNQTETMNKRKSHFGRKWDTGKFQIEARRTS